MNNNYELAVVDGMLEIKYRSAQDGKTDYLLVPFEDAIPMIFHAATVLSRVSNDAVLGSGDFHAFLKELKRRGTISN
jgi:hypothetical protein